MGAETNTTGVPSESTSIPPLSPREQALIDIRLVMLDWKQEKLTPIQRASKIEGILDGLSELVRNDIESAKVDWEDGTQTTRIQKLMNEFIEQKRPQHHDPLNVGKTGPRKGLDSPHR